MADYKNSTPPTGDSTIITSRAYGFPGFWQRYSYLVPTGKTSVTISTAGSQGDISLYVNADGAVTQTKYDCQSKNPGSNESCTLAVNAGQSLQIGLLGIVSYDWVKLVATAQ